MGSCNRYCDAFCFITVSSVLEILVRLNATNLSHPVEGDRSILQAAGLFYKLQDSLAVRQTSQLDVNHRTLLEQEVSTTLLYQLRTHRLLYTHTNTCVDIVMISNVKSTFFTQEGK